MIMNVEKYLLSIAFLNLIFSPCINAEGTFLNTIPYDSNQYVEQKNSALIDTSNKSNLIRRVREEGSIRIWVHYNSDLYGTELPGRDNFNKRSIDLRKQRINDFHNIFLDDLDS